METSASVLRNKIRAELPASIFDPQPLRALLYIPLIAFIGTAMWALVKVDMPWYAVIPVIFLLGQAIGIMGFVGHEAMHGSVVKSKFLQNVMGFISFAPFAISPQLWNAWHNKIHHGRTNQGDRDPDSYGTMKRYQRMPSTRFVANLAPGSGKWYSYFFLTYWFTFHGQVVLWVQTKFMRDFEKFNRVPAILTTLGIFVLIGAFAVWAGPLGFLLAYILPIMIGNFVVMHYIATNHFLRPQTETNEPVLNSMSVNTLPFINFFHLNFSHHIEHHMFPLMNPRFAPQVRKVLMRECGDKYVSPPHWKAIAFLYKTPRVYLDSKTLVNPYTGKTADLMEIEKLLSNRREAILGEGFDDQTSPAVG